ncbi:hypothetical protein UFOVP1229_157 [uncultured Caudovirales phage]|uniref:Uncharacterized protein n=1 Tax=uncultured Caudovirales phage TaxID=2100421 RepID=A0A6J5R7P1_9CAUD|nr:hypothetical protein UFOVP1229_157 [uncultured Caudovirales phage]
MTELYRNYNISYDPPPVPIRSCDYQFAHVDYDGPPDERCGTAPSFEEAKRQIDEIIADESFPISQSASLAMSSAIHFAADMKRRSDLQMLEEKESP